MAERNYSKCKIFTLTVFGLLNAFLFFASFFVDYQYMLAKEHTRFRKGFPSQANWVTSPYGSLNCYLFNVTNEKAFLNGTDKQLHLQEIGPIVYRVEGHNEILDQSTGKLRYRKLRYPKIRFDPELSSAPDVLNQTITMPHLILLSAAAKFHHFIMAKPVFNTITLGTNVFLTNTVEHFLWNFSTPALEMLSKYTFDITSNCGMLHNALRKKEEVYNVAIGADNNFEDFFRVETLNNLTYFPEHRHRLRHLKNDIYCPINVTNAFDNSIFPPFLQPEQVLDIVAAECCRTFRMRYNGTTKHLGFDAFKYIVSDDASVPHCMDDSRGIPLHTRMFDVTDCLFNEAPAAFSSPHFYGSSYNWSEHFKGLRPNEDDHEATIYIEPTTGITIEEKYRFQSNSPMPDMSGFGKKLELFSNMIIPTFWYEYDLDDLPGGVLLLLRINVYVVPILQPILIVVYFIVAFMCFMRIFLLLNGMTYADVFSKYFYNEGHNKALETKFEANYVESNGKADNWNKAIESKSVDDQQ